jgi:hypothetical protein
LSVEPALDQVTVARPMPTIWWRQNHFLRSDVRHALTVRLHAASDVEQTAEAS